MDFSYTMPKVTVISPTGNQYLSEKVTLEICAHKTKAEMQACGKCTEVK